MKNVERAYLAGFFDGEGCASVSYTQYRKKGRNRLYDSCRVHLAISNMDENVLRDVLLMIGEGGNTVKREYPVSELVIRGL